MKSIFGKRQAMTNNDHVIWGQVILLRRASTLLVAAVALAATTAPLVAQAVPADAVLRGFEPSGDFVLELDGKDLEHGEVYMSQRAVAYLILAPELASPLMISPRTGTVESVDLMKVVKRDDGTVDILADATLARIGSFAIEGKTVVFTIDGKTAKLKPRPPLLGLQTGQGLKSHNPHYGHQAARYHPSAEGLQVLRAVERPVRVRVYFGSWCSACKRLVPNVVRLDEELQGSKIEFEYYGLPHPMEEDPETERAGVHGVPTMFVYVAGKKVGELTGKDLFAPEAALGRLLGLS